MRKAKAKCQKETKAGRRKHKVALPWCVHISDGKKVLIRNRHCMCPSGWRNRDKCLSPNVDHTLPCSFNDPYNSTDSDRHTDSHFTVELNCSNKQVRLVYKTISASNWLSRRVRGRIHDNFCSAQNKKKMESLESKDQ